MKRVLSYSLQTFAAFVWGPIVMGFNLFNRDVIDAVSINMLIAILWPFYLRFVIVDKFTRKTHFIVILMIVLGSIIGIVYRFVTFFEEEDIIFFSLDLTAIYAGCYLMSAVLSFYLQKGLRALFKSNH